MTVTLAIAALQLWTVRAVEVVLPAATAWHNQQPAGNRFIAGAVGQDSGLRLDKPSWALTGSLVATAITGQPGVLGRVRPGRLRWHSRHINQRVDIVRRRVCAEFPESITNGSLVPIHHAAPLTASSLARWPDPRRARIDRAPFSTRLYHNCSVGGRFNGCPGSPAGRAGCRLNGLGLFIFTGWLQRGDNRTQRHLLSSRHPVGVLRGKDAVRPGLT